MGIELDEEGMELDEEVIIAAEGWRRHTRVYGGGVCQACEESEEQMRLMGVRPVEIVAWEFSVRQDALERERSGEVEAE
jgi:hypothetical protein